MKRHRSKREKSSRIRLADDEEDAITYCASEGQAGADAYFATIMAHGAVHEGAFESILDFAKHRTHLTRFCIDVTTGVVKLPEGKADMDRLVQYVMRCYILAHRRACEFLDAHVENGVRHMWTLAMHMYGVVQWANPGVVASMGMCASEFSFCRSVLEGGREQICVSDDPIARYSVRIHWQAFTTALPALYDFAYSPAMYEYVRTLIVRHAQLLEGTDDPEDYDDPLFCAPAVDGENNVHVLFQHPKDPSVYLNDLYSAQADVLMGCQMLRLMRVRHLFKRARRDGCPESTAPTPKAIADGMVAYVEWLSKHNILRSEIVDPMRDKVLTPSLMHGERIRFMRKNPKLEAEADNIMSALRQADYARTGTLLQTPIFEMAAQYAAECGPGAEHEDYTMRKAPPYERQLTLALYILMYTWMTYRGAPRTFVSERIYMEEMHVGEEEKGDLFVMPPQRPALVRCMRWQFVFDSQDRVVFAGPSLFMGYLEWLRCVRDQSLGPLKLNDDVIHEKMRALLDMLPPSRSGAGEGAASSPLHSSPPPTTAATRPSSDASAFPVSAVTFFS